jgi:hypothetical protein
MYTYLAKLHTLSSQLRLMAMSIGLFEVGFILISMRVVQRKSI